MLDPKLCSKQDELMDEIAHLISDTHERIKYISINYDIKVVTLFRMYIWSMIFYMKYV